ncbi:MAG: HEPN domain-containing protein [Firmicutes bacterium]|nr:HEPN domain-containing protein [Bacillota bacterium]
MKSSSKFTSAIGVEPPKQHDVGGLLLEHAVRFQEDVKAELQRLADISKWLRKEREFAFYGDVDFIPTDEYSEEDAERAREDARFAVTIARRAMLAD